jgi:hypothetical protein
MSQLTEKVQELKRIRALEEEKKEAAIQEELRKMGMLILREFEEAFKDFLPLLAEEGISYAAYFNTRYTYQGAYILFTKGSRACKMDFSNRTSYRYEYNKYELGRTGNSVYGEWPKEEFLLFLDRELLEPLPEQPCVREPDPDVERV